ncbi:MAG: ATP-binding protein, partial [Acidithiobacillus sp.]
MTPFTAQFLQQQEGKTLEFKRDLSSPKPLLKTLVAFANSAGGFLVLGVTDDRQIIGIEQPLDEEERLCNLIADAIAPRLVPNIELLTIEGKTLLVVEVYPSGQRPHWLKAEGPDNGVFVRLGSTNRQADRELVAELRRSVEGAGFDEMPMPDLSVDDLDIAAAQQLFGASRTLDEKTLLTLKLLSSHQGKLVPTKGAVLLFGKERLQHFPDAWIQCGRFFGTEKLDIFDHIELDQPLPKAVDEVMLFLKKHAMRGADLSEVRRKDIWSIPLSILREVVINALVHADYSQRGAPVRVVFLDDRIEIENPGLLLPGMTIEDMKQGASKIRNTVIARVFRELHLIEQWGTGVRRIFTEAQELGLPEPQIKEIGMRVRFIVPLLEPISLRKETQPDGEQVSEQVSEQVLSMLQACRVRERSKQELLEVAGLANVYLNY